MISISEAHNRKVFWYKRSVLKVLRLLKYSKIHIKIVVKRYQNSLLKQQYNTSNNDSIFAQHSIQILKTIMFAVLFSCIFSTDSNRKTSAVETSGMQIGCGTNRVLFLTRNTQTESVMWEWALSRWINQLFHSVFCDVAHWFHNIIW